MALVLGLVKVSKPQKVVTGNAASLCAVAICKHRCNQIIGQDWQLKTAEHGQLSNIEGGHLSASPSGWVRCLTRMPPSGSASGSGRSACTGSKRLRDDLPKHLSTETVIKATGSSSAGRGIDYGGSNGAVKEFWQLF